MRILACMARTRTTRRRELDPVLVKWGSDMRDRRRRLLGISQAEFATRLDPPVDQSTVARWEAGVMEPRRHYKPQIAELLHAAPEVLFASPPPTRRNVEVG